MSSDLNSPIIVFMTAASNEEAKQLADMLVEADLAACVQILPQVESVYRWKGSIERGSEVLIIAKTLRSKFDELDRRVRESHSYETPEIVAISATAVSQPYREWLIASLDSRK